MTDRLTPGPEARARIQQLSQKELQAFFDEVPASAMRSLAPYLPPVDGFRRGSPAGIVKQKEALARRLSRPIANENDFKALYMVWRTWIDETQPNAPMIQDLIEELEEAADKADGAEVRGRIIEERTESILQRLKEESEQNRSTRESIERLYTFSPLPETIAARGIIAGAKLAVDVERDAAYRNLPTRLDQDEREIQSIKSELKSLAQSVAAAADDSAKVLRELPGLRDDIREVRSSYAALAAVSEQTNKPVRGQDESDRIEAHIKTLAGELDVLRESFRALAPSRDQIQQAAEATRKLGEMQAKLAEAQQQQAGEIDQVAAALEQAKRDVDALLEDRTQPDRIAPLAGQIAELSQRIEAIAAQPHPSYPVHDAVRRAPSTGGALHWVSLPAPGNAAAISSHTGLAAVFAGALRHLGMRRSGAQLLAEECAAAIAARQAVFLQGAFAARAVRALAVATGGAASARLAMPIGMQDGGQLRFAIEQAFESLRDGVGGLAVEGINHVPLDLVREIIADCIGPVPGSTPYRRIAVFGALSRGVASLSIEPETFELGPVFDLDYFDWRTGPADTPQPEASFLSAKADEAIYAQIADAGANAEEAVRLAQALVPKRNPAIERSVVRAYQALHLMRSDPKTVTPLHSLFYGWLLPYWRALGLSREQVDSEFDGGKVHGAPLDGRLTALFAAEFPDPARGGEP